MATVPIDLKKLLGVVGNDVVEKDRYDKLVKKVNVTNTSKLVNKKDYNINIKGIEDKILSITNLADNAALIAVENEIATLVL